MDDDEGVNVPVVEVDLAHWQTIAILSDSGGDWFSDPGSDNSTGFIDRSWW